MRKFALKMGLVNLFTLLMLSSCPAWSEVYIHRDLMANTLPSQKCLEKSAAISRAQDAYLLRKKENVFCETQGYGWHLETEKTSGKLVCSECDGAGNQGKFQCHVEDIVVACKRIKPFSSGLIPGVREY